MADNPPPDDWDGTFVMEIEVKIPRSTLEQWQVLQAIVECGGYAQAAEALHRSQSSVSYMVAKLQEQLGVELLEIDGRRARLTKNGEALLNKARELLGDAFQLEQLAGSLAEGWEPQVSIAVDSLFPVELLVQVLREFEPWGQAHARQPGGDGAVRLRGRAD